MTLAFAWKWDRAVFKKCNGSLIGPSLQN